MTLTWIFRETPWPRYRASLGEHRYEVERVDSAYTRNVWEVRLDGELLSDWPTRNEALGAAVEHARAHAPK